jgi:hypothetical protein
MFGAEKFCEHYRKWMKSLSQLVRNGHEGVERSENKGLSLKLKL